MNNTAALYSFLRVLAVALASAVLPFATAPQSDEVPVRAIVYAVIAAFLLTLINWLRPGEPRFGPEPKVEVGDAGYSLVEVMVAAFFAVLIVFLLARLI